MSEAEKPLLFPQPKKVEWLAGGFAAPTVLKASIPDGFSGLCSLIEGTLGRDIATVDADDAPDLLITADPGLAPQAYRLHIDGEGALIAASTAQGAYYGLQTLAQVTSLGDVWPACEIEDFPALLRRGFMLDISRGKVPRMDDLFALVDRLAALKYNELQLYVEGFSFAYPSFLETWSGLDPMTPAQIRELDAYCSERFIELVPNQNSLGHMAAWLARPEFADLAVANGGISFIGGTMPVSTANPLDPRTLELVERLMDDLLPNFSSGRFNVNLDEPFELGTGKTEAAAQEIGVEGLYMDYLEKLHAAVAARGKKMVMFGDILTKHPTAIERLPRDVTVLDWGYEDYTPFEGNARMLEEAGVSFMTCPGTSTWTSVTGRTDVMLANISHAADAAAAHGGEGLLLTEWGDNGHIEYGPLNEPAIAHAAACAWGDAHSEEDLAAYLDRFVYRDPEGKTAGIVMDLGHARDFEELPMTNMTLASMQLMLGLLPEGAFAATLEQLLAVFLQLAGPSASLAAERMQVKGAFDYEGWSAHVANLRERLATARPADDLVKRELQNSLALAEFTGGVHALNAGILPRDPALLAELAEKGRAFLDEHPALWLARNRPAGMEIGMTAVQRLVAQLEA